MVFIRTIKNIVNIKFLNFNFFISFYLFFIQMRNSYNESCKTGNSISNIECFNNIIKFSDKNYRAGSFAENKNGDIVIEYSADNSRLFYGLRNDGKYFFNNESSIKVIENIGNDDGMPYRYESKNIFVSLENDIKKDNQYLLSISSNQTLSELHNFSNNRYTIRKTKNFIGNEIYPPQFSLLGTQIENKNIYFCIYIHLNGVGSNLYTIKKFGLTEFNLTSYHDIQNLQLNDNLNNTMQSCLIIDEEKIILIFYIKIKQRLSVSYFDFNLNPKGQGQEIYQLSNIYPGTGIFFKSIYLNNNIIALIFFKDGDQGNSLSLRIFHIILLQEGIYNKDLILEYNINKYNFKTNITLNDFIKLNNERIAFISTIEFTTLYILVFDLYNNYASMEIRVYKYQLTNYKVINELSAFIYKDYLVFSSTVKLLISPENVYSIFMIFGYANETESIIIIDIYPYFSDIDNYDYRNNIIIKLFEKLTIDNNIFGYIPAYQLKLISIPNEIIFYNGNESESLSNGDILEFEHKINQNNYIIKNNDYYSFEFQFIIQEPDYENLFSNAHELINYTSDLGTYEQKKYYGKTNTVKFKLCHDYCASCKTLGKSKDDQQCMSCLEDYQYDYFNEYPSNCVPFDYFNDKQERKLIKCNNTNSKYYINSTNNKKICFKNTYDCPSDYHYLNISSNECQKYTPPTTIISIKSTIIQTNTPAIIPTTLPIKLNTMVPIIIPSILPNSLIEKCSYNDLVNNKCSFENNNNTEIYHKIKNEIIQTYPTNGESIVIKGEDNYIFQVTTDDNEINTLNGNYENEYNLSVIDLDECEILLKKKYGIDEDDNLIIYKYEKLTNISSHKNVQYEVFNPNTLEQLNLSICKDASIDIYIPISLSKEKQHLYNDLKESGYDLFDENDSFYTDICTPYKSKNGTDVLLSDRKNDFYNNSEVTCQANCNFSSYLSESKYLKCECNVSFKDIEILEAEKLIGVVITNSFCDALKYSNFYVLKCYKLVFNLNIFKKNIGSIISLVYFLLYLIFVIIYIFKGISPLKNSILNLISKNEVFNKVNNNSNLNNKKNNKNNNINDKNNSQNYDKNQFKKKIKSRNKTDKSLKNIKRDNKKNSQILSLKKINKNAKTKSYKLKKISSPIKKKRNRNKNSPTIKNVFVKISNKINLKKHVYLKDNKIDSNSLMILREKSVLNGKANALETKKKNLKNKKNSKIFTKDKLILNGENKNKLTNFELNDLDYFQAIKLDKRTFCQIYWSILKREHLILFTFLSPNDYNLIYVKFARLFFLICQDMAMNIIFFSDNSMHKLYANYGKYDFIQQIPQIIYSIVVSQIIEVFICYLNLTDIYFYKVKKIINKKVNKNKILGILRCIKIKLFVFFTFTFILFLFYWYFISSFCAVYQNTQITFIKDSISSFLTGLLYPFAFYLFPPILRIIALKDASKKRLKCIYKLSDIIPLF